jgi:hypothetical protein
VAHPLFEVLPSRIGRSPDLVYWRNQFMTWEVYIEHRSDEDFTGRLHTLFGPQPTVRYTLRDVETGVVILATREDNVAGYTVPGFDTNAAARDPIVIARIGADPVLASPRPLPPLSSEDGTLQRSREYALHEADARAPRGFGEVARRLSALVEAAPPAEWEALRYDRLTDIVVREGFAAGASLRIEVEFEAAMSFLIERAEDRVDSDPWNNAVEALSYARARAERLGSYRPRVEQLWRELGETAETLVEPDRIEILGWLQRYATDLGIG